MSESAISKPTAPASDHENTPLLGKRNPAYVDHRVISDNEAVDEGREVEVYIPGKSNFAQTVNYLSDVYKDAGLIECSY
jgi:hypothetical protein